MSRSEGEGASSRPRPVEIVLVAAIAENGVIGRDGGLPWRLRSDLQHFRRETIGRPVVMGRRTALSLGKPLAGRTNIVVSRDPDFAVRGMMATAGIAQALTVARGDALRRAADRICVIGGADVYVQTLDLADRLIITRVHLSPSGDTLFPAIDASVWREVERTEHSPGAADDAGFTILVYVRSH